MLDPSISPNAAAVFGLMSEAEIKASVAKVVALSDEAIQKTVLLNGYGTLAEREALASTLIARKGFLAATYPDVIQKVGLAKTQAVYKIESAVSSVTGYLDLEILEAIKGISFRASKLSPLEDKDFARVASVMARYQELLDNATALTEDSYNKLVAGYKPWIDHLQTSIAAGPGSTAVWGGGKFNALSGLLSKVDIDTSRIRVSITPDMFGVAAAGGGPKFTGAQAKKILSDVEDRFRKGRHVSMADVPSHGAEGKLFDVMPPEYKRAIWSWTPSSIYDDVTRELLKSAFDGVTLSREVEQYKELLNDALAHAPKARIHKGLSTRGHIHDPAHIDRQIKKLREIMKNDGVYSPESFYSSTKGGYAAFQRKLEYSIQGKTGVHINSISSHSGSEDEVLFSMNAKFKVKAIVGPDANGKIIVHLVEI